MRITITFFCCVLFFLTSHSLLGQASSIAVYDISEISNSDVRNCVFDATKNAFQNCGNYRVRHNVEWKSPSRNLSDLQLLEQQVADIIVNRYVLQQRKDHIDDALKIQQFREKVQSTHIVMVKLDINPAAPEGRDYELHLYVVDINTLHILSPSTPISFEKEQMYNQSTIEEAILAYLRGNSLCTTSQINENNPDRFLEWFRMDMYLLAMLRYYYPDDLELRREFDEVSGDNAIAEGYWEAHYRFFCSLLEREQRQIIERGHITHAEKGRYLSHYSEIIKSLQRLEQVARSETDKIQITTLRQLWENDRRSLLPNSGLPRY